MNLKVAPLLLVMFFALAVTTTATIFNIRVPKIFGTLESTLCKTTIGVEPTGDPVDGDLPHVN